MVNLLEWAESCRIEQRFVLIFYLRVSSRVSCFHLLAKCRALSLSLS